MRKPPLDGIRVLDLTRLLPGALCTQHLADMGADVIKVEDTGQGDYARTTRGYFRLVNRNKRSMRIDLKHETGKAIFDRLVDTAAKTRGLSTAPSPVTARTGLTG